MDAGPTLSFSREPYNCNLNLSCISIKYTVLFELGRGEKWGMMYSLKLSFHPIRDVSMKKETASGLKQSEERLQNLLSSLGVGVYRVAADGSFLYVNETLARMFGYKSVNEFIALKAYDHYAGEKDKHNISHANEKTGQHQERKKLCNKKDGTMFYIKATSIATKNSDGDNLYFDGIIEDLTQQKETEKILQDRDHLLAHTLDDLNAFIGIINTEGAIVFANNTALGLCNYKPADVLGRNYFDMDWWGTSEKSKMLNRNAFEKCKKGEPVIFEGEVFRKGDRMHIAQSMHPIFDKEKNVMYVVPEAHDITKQKIIENELRKSHNDLEKRVKERTSDLINTNAKLIREISYRKSIETKLRVSLQEKEILLSEIHHRVKNNLQIVSSLLAMAATRHRNQEGTQVLSDSRNRIQTMAMIHEHLYKTDSFQSIDMVDIIKKMANSIFGTTAEEDGRILFHFKPEDISLSLKQAIPCSLIINELLSNVQKHAYPSGEDRGVQIIMQLVETNKILLCVKDDGIGLADDMDIDKIGSLGLKLVRILAKEQLKGDIRFNGHGGTESVTTFDKESGP